MIILITRRAGAGGLVGGYLAVIVTVLTILFCLFGLPVVAYFVFIKDCPSLIIGLAQSIPLLLTCAIYWFIAALLFCKFVLKKDILPTATLTLTGINRIVRYMLILSLLITLIIKLTPSSPLPENSGEMVFGALFAYNFIFAILEIVIMLREEAVGKKAFLSLVFAFVGACIIGAVAMEVEALKPVMFEIVTFSMLLILEVSMLIFRKVYDRY